MIVLATSSTVYAVEPSTGVVREADGIDARQPSCLTAAVHHRGSVWCGSEDGGVFQSDDGGISWARAGLDDVRVTALAASPADANILWAGTEPSHIWRSDDAGTSWQRCQGLRDLPSSRTWSFPPRPDTDHVRWIACHPTQGGRLWIAIEAGALISTTDGGRSWEDRVERGPYDTHELAVDPRQPDWLRVAAGDGYFESLDGGRTWSAPEEGLEVGYLRSVAVDPHDPGVVVVSAASHPYAAYVAGRSDGRLYRREDSGAWKRITRGWPDPPDTIAPLLTADASDGALLAADERGVHRSRDSGRSWERIAEFPAPVDWLRALVVVPPQLTAKA